MDSSFTINAVEVSYTLTVRINEVTLYRIFD